MVFPGVWMPEERLPLAPAARTIDAKHVWRYFNEAR